MKTKILIESMMNEKNSNFNFFISKVSFPFSAFSMIPTKIFVSSLHRLNGTRRNVLSTSCECLVGMMSHLVWTQRATDIRWLRLIKIRKKTKGCRKVLSQVWDLVKERKVLQSLLKFHVFEIKAKTVLSHNSYRAQKVSLALISNL